MAEHLSPSVQAQIRELAEEIAGAEALSEELRQELAGHIEDKLLGYMRGEETVSEADAFLLAREHFGDRQDLRESLGVERPSAYTQRYVVFFGGLVLLVNFVAVLFMTYYLLWPWLAYLVAVVLLSPLVWMGLRLLEDLRTAEPGRPLRMSYLLLRRVLSLVLLLHLLSVAQGVAAGFWFWLGVEEVFLSTFLVAVLLFLSLLLVWRLLVRWKAAEQRSSSAWFLRWEPRHFLWACLGILVMDVLLHHYNAWIFGYPHEVPEVGTAGLGYPALFALLFLALLTFALYPVLCGALCVWWCGVADADGRRVAQVVLVFSLVYWGLGLGGSLLSLDVQASHGFTTLAVLLSFWSMSIVLYLLGGGLFWLTQRRQRGHILRLGEVA